MCVVTTARYTQTDLGHAMETLDDEVFYAVYQWVVENEQEYEAMGQHSAGFTNNQFMGIVTQTVEALVAFSQNTCIHEIKEYVSNIAFYTDNAMNALLKIVDKPTFGSRRFARFAYTVIMDSIRQDLVDNLYELIL